MSTAKEVAQVFDIVLSSPGMSEQVKVNLKLSRKNVLLLHQVIRRGLSVDDQRTSGLLANVPPESLQELEALAAEFLHEAGLTEMSEKLAGLGEAK